MYTSTCNLWAHQIEILTNLCCALYIHRLLNFYYIIGNYRFTYKRFPCPITYLIPHGACFLKLLGPLIPFTSLFVSFSHSPHVFVSNCMILLWLLHAAKANLHLYMCPLSSVVLSHTFILLSRITFCQQNNPLLSFTPYCWLLIILVVQTTYIWIFFLPNFRFSFWNSKYF